MESLKNDSLKINENNYKINPIREGFATFFLSLFVTFIGAYLIYFSSMKVLETEIKEGLLRTVSGIAAILDGDLLQSFNNPNQAENPKYQEMVKLIQRARIGIKNCSYLYINTMVDGKVYFIIDPVSIDENGKPIYIDEASLEPSIPMSPYEDADIYLKRALTDRVSVVADEIYTDRWGTFYSAYVPIYNSKHEMIGTLGADLRNDEMTKRFLPIIKAAITAACVSFLLALLLGISVWYARKNAIQSNLSKEKIYKNLEIVKRYANQSSNTLSKQFEKSSGIFNYIAEKLSLIGKEDNFDSITRKIHNQKNKFESIAEKLPSLGLLKFSTRNNDLEYYSIKELNLNLFNVLAGRKEIEDIKERLDYYFDEEIPEKLYGSAVSYEEIVANLYDFCLSLSTNLIYSKTLLLNQDEKEVEIRQTIALSMLDIETSNCDLLETFCKHINSSNLCEQSEIADYINIPIMQELLYILNSEMKAEIKDQTFRVSFDFKLLKTNE